jgi:phage baseplate assembly protein gpV
MMEAWRNFIHLEVQRFLDRRIRKMPCIVTGYRGDLHAVKVELQPSGTQSGWIQVETDQVGNLVAPNIGDPGWLDFHEDDRRAAVFVGSNHNDLFPPPQAINAGERFTKTSFGSSVYLKNDGSVTVTDKAGTVIECDGTGNATVTATTAVTVKAPAINLGDGGTLLPVLLANNQPSTVVKAQ